MTRRTLYCDRVLTRRSAIVALSGTAAMIVLGTSAAAAETRPFADLVGADGSASNLARSLASSLVSVRGYLAPSLDGREFTLTEQPVAPCQLCGASHDAGRSLVVLTSTPNEGAPMLQQVQATGRLEVGGAPGSAVRLVASQIQPV